MCGIFCEVTAKTEDSSHENKTWNELKRSLRNRGPDHFSDTPLVLETEHHRIHLASSVLWLRGQNLVKQPFVTDQGNVLLWNGDIFGGLEVDSSLCDTLVLAQHLDRSSDVSDVLSRIRGPFAFVYFRVDSNEIFFGRDFFGRHSLLYHSSSSSKDQPVSFLLTSVAKAQFPVYELPSSGIFRLDLSTDELRFGLRSWTQIPLVKFNFNTELSLDVQDLGHDVILPSAAELDLTRTCWRDEALSENWSFNEVLKVFLQKENRNVSNLRDSLLSAVKTRVEKQPNLCKKCITKVSLHQEEELIKKCKEHAKIGVLFSGGLDSVILTRLVDEIVNEEEEIDLLNVAFQQMDGSFEVPDRLTALQALDELKHLNPRRRFNFIEVNVTKSELIEARDSEIQHLLHPLQTVLDDSIGCALWFCGRGSGKGGFQSTARVVLLGMGADEQLGGYSRHRVKFNQGGICSLSEEIKMEVLRISSRNLGRDNRILADHGIAPRYPYLDRNVVNLLSSLSTSDKMDLRFPRGVGEKILLRSLAFQMGLTRTALEPKRAIQFGSRIAKMENRKEKGSDICKRPEQLL